MKACEKLFKYVSLSDSEEIETIYEKDIISYKEDIEMFKRFFVNLGEVGDLAFNDRSEFDINGVFNEMILDGAGLSQEWNFPSDENLSLGSQDDMNIDLSIQEMEDGDSSEYGEDKDEILNNVDWSVFTVSQDIGLDEVEWNWTYQNILLSIKLLNIIKDKQLASKISRDISKLSHINSKTILNIVSMNLNELRQLYFGCLRESANKVLGHNRITGLIAGFTNRKISEIKDKSEEAEELSESDSTSELNKNNQNIEDYRDEPVYNQFFYTWLNDESLRVQSTVPKVMKRMIKAVKEENKPSNDETNISDELKESLDNLDTPCYYDYLKGYYNEDSFLKEISEFKKKEWKECCNILKRRKMDIEEKIVFSSIILHKNTKLYDLNDIANVLSRSLMKRKYHILNLLKTRISKSLNSNSYLKESINFTKEWKDALNQWNNEYLKWFKEYSMCGIWFMKIFSRRQKNIQLDKSELYLLERLWRHHEIFKKEKLPGIWVFEYETNKLFSSDYENTITDEKDQNKPIGFSIWSYWKTSFRDEQKYRKVKNGIPYFKFDRKKIGKLDFDFLKVPNVINNVPKIYLDHIQFGMMYIKPNTHNALRMMMITGDTGYRLSNGSIGVMRKLGLKKVKDKSRSEQKIIDAIKWLKENNPLARTYLTLYESNAILDKIEEMNKFDKEKYKDDYYIVDEIDIDRKIHTVQILDKLGRKYAILKEIPKILKDNLLKRKEIKDRSLVLYEDYYLEEKLFVHLFPYGTGGYNSTFWKIMDFSHYIRMRLCSGYTDRFRKDKEYIFFLYDWAKKLQIYRNNFIAHRVKIGEFDENKIPEDEVLPIKTQSDYFKRFGAKIPQSLRNWIGYKRNRFYEVQTILQNYGMPNLFVTVRLNPADTDCNYYVSSAFSLGEGENHPCIDHAVEYSVYFKNKINFIRNIFKQRNQRTIFGNIVASWDVIEYTSSGIPHLHALIWLANEHKYLATVEGNALVYASKVNPRYPRNKDLNKLIEMYQTHICIKEKCNIKKNGEYVNYWLNGYPFKPISRDSIDKDSNKILYRRKLEDDYITSYNPELLMIAQWPTNVQIVTSDSVAVYLSKYITKVNKYSISDKEKWESISKDNAEEITEVERYFKERKVGCIEAWNDLLYLKHYSNRPSVTNFWITLPSDRLCRLVIYKDLVRIIEKNKEIKNDEVEDIEEDEKVGDDEETKSEDNEEDDLLILDDEESKEESKVEREGIFQPNHWENYLWRSKKLETVTFPEMLTNYQWCSRLDLVPAHWKKPDENGNINYWEQQSVNVLMKRLRDCTNNLSRSHTINDIIRTHRKVNLTEKYQIARYWFKRKNNLLFNCKYRLKREKDELFWYIEILDREHFRYFDELLTFDGKIYWSFFSAWKAKGYLKEVEEKEEIIQNRFNIGGLEKTIHGIWNGEINVSFEEIRIIILKLVQTLQLKNNNVWINRLKELSIQYCNSFPLLFDEIQKSSMIKVKEDPIEIFKHEISWNSWWKVPFIMDWAYKKLKGEEIKLDSDLELMWRHYYRYEPIITEKLDKNLKDFSKRYFEFSQYTTSQRKIINFLIKNLFHPTRNLFFITGYAGCGKSFLLKELVFLFREVLNLNVLVWATTGTAAKNIDGMTVHRAFKYNSKDVWSFPLPGTSQFENLKKQDIIIIDEVSMMTGECLDFIDASWRNAGLYSRYRWEDMNKPFGGKMVILFGDLLQIPWVQEEQVGTKLRLYRKIKDTYIFKGFQWLFLKEQKRQAKDYEYYSYWKSIALGEIDEEIQKWLGTRVWEYKENKSTSLYLKSENHLENIENSDEWDARKKTDITWVASTNKIKTEVNKRRQNIFLRQSKYNQEYKFKAIYYSRMYEITDSDTLNYLRSVFSDEHTYEEELILRKGAKVILNVNIDVKMGLTNGTIGEIKEIEQNIIHFEYEFKEKKLIAFITRTEKDDTVPYLHVTRWQFPISLAYCLTMHKCQGQTLDGVVINWDNIQTQGLFYSILARCKNSRRIHIKNLIVNDHILTDSDTVDLIKEKEIEYDKDFKTIEGEYGTIRNLEKMLVVIRETKMSMASLHNYLFNFIYERRTKWEDLFKEVRDFNIEIYDVLYNKIKDRKDIMMKFYNLNLAEQRNNPNIIIDWRSKLEDDWEELMQELLDNLFNKDVLDLDLEEKDEDLVPGMLIDIDEITKKDESKEEDKESFVDMDIDSSIHDYKEDGRIPWSFWRSDLKGFDSLLLLFYFGVYKSLETKVERDNFKNFIPKQFANKNRYIHIINSVELIDNLNPMMKYSNENTCQRLQIVIKPWVEMLKNNDRIDKQFECFEGVHSLFVIEYKEVRTCYGKWLPSNNETTLNNEDTILDCIKIKDLRYTKPHLNTISSSILKNTLLRDKFAKCSNWGSRMMSIDIIPWTLPKFIWIVNDQEPALDGSRHNRFKVDMEIEFGATTKYTYNLKGVIFKSNYNFSSWINIDINNSGEYKWYSYDGEKNRSMLERMNNNFGKNILFNYRNLEHGYNKWPVIFLYRRKSDSS